MGEEYYQDMAAEEGGGALMSYAYSEVDGAVNWHATSQLRGPLWDNGSSKTWKCDCISIKVNDGRLAHCQRHLGGR